MRGKANETVQCQRVCGAMPISAAIQGVSAGISPSRIRLHTPMMASRPAYQSPGRVLWRIGPSSNQEPRAKPAKKALTTASTDTISWPRLTASMRVQTIS